MLRIKFDYKKLNPNATSVLDEYEIESTYYFSTEPLDYDGNYWEARITDSFEIERFFDITADTTNRIRTLSVTLDNHDHFFNQFVENGKTLLNNQMTLYYSDGVSSSKNFTGTIQEIESFSSVVRLKLREIGYEYLEEKFPDAQIAYDYYSDNGINDSWNAIPIHFGRVDDYPVSWVNSFYSEFMVGSGPILRITKIYIDKDHEDGDEYGVDDGVVYYRDSNGTEHETNYKVKKTDGDDQIIHVRIFLGTGWDADEKREFVVDTHRPENVDTSRWTNGTTSGTYKHISQWGGFAYIQFYRLETKDVNGTPTEYEVPAYPLNHDGSVGQVYVCLEGIVSVTKSGNTYTYGNTMVRNPAEIIKMMFCNDEFVSEGPCAIGWGYKESVCNFAQAIDDCNTLGFKVDGTFNESQPFSEALKQILYVCRGIISEENEKITLSIDKQRTRIENNQIVLDVKAEFDESGEIGHDCILEEWHEPQLDEQYNRIRLSYDYNAKKQRCVKKPDPNHESPDYDSSNPSGTSQYDAWLHDTTSYYKLKKWNTTEIELRLVRDTMTAHKLASYYLRKALYQKITGSITVANEHSENLDAGNLIRIRSKQFGWYEPSDDLTGKVFQITSIRKGEENTSIDFVDYNTDIFLLDGTPSMNVKTTPAAVKQSLMPKTPKTITVAKEIVNGSNGTNLVYAKVTLTYQAGTNMINALIQYADMGTSQPSSAPSDSDQNHPWVDFDTTSGTVSKKSVTPGHYYYFRACTVNVNGTSAFKTSSYIKMDGDNTAPSAPTIESEQINGRNILLKLSLNSAPSDFKGFKLYKDDTYITSIIADIGSNGNAVCEHTDVCEHYRTTYVYKAKSYDIWGNESAYSQSINVRTPDDIDLENISETIQLLNQDIIDTNTRIDGYVSDNVLSINEKAQLAQDWIAIRDSRYDKVKTEAENHYFNSAISVYNQDYLDFVEAYEELEAYVDGNGSIINLTPTPPAVLTESNIEGIGSTVKGKFADYYDLEIKVLSDIDTDNKNRASTTYAECHTASATASKIVILPNIVVFKGLRLCVKFFNGNTSPGVITLNIKRDASDENGLINGGKLYHSSGFAIPVITFEAGTTITLVLTEKTETVEGVETTVQAWEFSDSSILGLGEKELSLGNKTYNLGMVNGNRIIAETVDTQQLNAQAVTSEKITSEEIVGKDFVTTANVGDIDEETHEYIAGVRFNANGIKAYNTSGETVSIGIDGQITAIMGYIGGWKITSSGIESSPTSSSLPKILLNPNGMILSSNFATNVSGWRIDSYGNAEFNSAIIRGKIQSAVFEYDKISAIGGKMLVKPASVVYRDSTHISTSTTLYIKDSTEFAVGECFLVKDPDTQTGGTFYGIISAITTETLSDGNVIGILTYSIPSEGGTFFTPTDGQSVINYGNPMSGGLVFEGSEGYLDIFKNHTGSNDRNYNIYNPVLNVNAYNSTTASIVEENGVVDISGESNHGQAFGNTEVVYDKEMDRCFYFDGATTSYIKMDSQSLLNKINGKTAFTISVRARLTGSRYYIGGLYSSNGSYLGVFYIDSSNYINFSDKISSTGTSNSIYAQLSDNYLWHTFTVVVNYSGGYCILYVDGTEVARRTSWATGTKADVAVISFGANHNASSATYTFNGAVSDVKIFDRMLTSEEVSVVHNQSLVTPYLNTNMYSPRINLDSNYPTNISYISNSRQIIDISGNKISFSPYATSGTARIYISDKGYKFDGNSYIYSNYIFNSNISEMTLSMTINATSYASSSTSNYIIYKYYSYSEWYLMVTSSKIIFRIYNTSGNYTEYETDENTSPATNVDCSICVTVSNTTKKINIYINGTLSKSFDYTDTKKINAYSSNQIRIGYRFNGIIKDIKIYDKALTAEQVYNNNTQLSNPEAFENPDRLISPSEINVHHFSDDAIQLDHLVRLGNLKGIADIIDDRYGIFLGDDRSYLKYDSVDGLKLINSNFALDGSILSDNFTWTDGNGAVHDDIDMEIASDPTNGITSGQRFSTTGSMINMTTGAIVTPTFRTKMPVSGSSTTAIYIQGSVYPNNSSGCYLGSSSSRWQYVYANNGDFNNTLYVRGNNSSDSYSQGIRILPGYQMAGIFLGGRDYGSTGTSAKSWFIANNDGVLGVYRNGNNNTNSTQWIHINNGIIGTNMMVSTGQMKKLYPNTLFHLDVSYQKSTSVVSGTVIYAVSNIISDPYIFGFTVRNSMNLNSLTSDRTGQHFQVIAGNRLEYISNVVLNDDFTFLCDIITNDFTVSPHLICIFNSSSDLSNALILYVNTSRQIVLSMYDSSGTPTNYTFENCVCVEGDSSRIGVSVSGTTATCMVNGITQTQTIVARSSSFVNGIDEGLNMIILGNDTGDYMSPCGHMSFPTLILQALDVKDMYNLLENGILFSSNQAMYSHYAKTATNADKVKCSNLTSGTVVPLGISEGSSNNSYNGVKALVNDVKLDRWINTSNNQGFSIVKIGNNKPIGTDGNSTAAFHLYGSGANHMTIDMGTIANDNKGIIINSPLTEQRTYTLSDADGRIPVLGQYPHGTSQGWESLVLGNDKGVGTDGNLTGSLSIFGKGSNRINFNANEISSNMKDVLINSSITANRTYTLPDADGTIALTSSNITGSSGSCTGNAATATTATNANNLKVTHTGASWRDILSCPTGFTSASNQAVYGHNSGSVAYYVDANATSGTQRAILRLGNGIANTTAAGHNGQIWMYGTSTGYTILAPEYNSTSSITVYFPSSAGTLALKSDIPNQADYVIEKSLSNTPSAGGNTKGVKGYRKWNSGLIEVWDKPIETFTSKSSHTVTFPKAFTKIPFVFISKSHANSTGDYASSTAGAALRHLQTFIPFHVTTTGFEIGGFQQSNDLCTCSYYAIGF